MSRVIEDVLAVWRDGERLLETLTPIDQDHETIALSVGELRRLYARMTEARDVSDAKLASAERVVESSKAVMERVRRRLEDSAEAKQATAPSPILDLQGDPG